MQATELRENLIKEIKENDLEHFFASTQQYISQKSDLQNIILLLANRTRRLKMSSLNKTISFENQELEKNKIVQELLEVVSLISEADLKVVIVEDSLNSLISEIAHSKIEFQNIVKDKSEGLLRIGQNLIDLGGILREKPSPDDKIPHEEKIKIGAQKGARRINIGFMELKELKNSMIVGVHKIGDAHTRLVEYLDFPKEEIGTNQIINIKGTAEDFGNFINRINPEHNIELEQIRKAKQMFIKVLPYKEQLGASFDSFFQAADVIIQKCTEMISFLEKNNDELVAAKSRLQTLQTELLLNIEEKGF